MSVVPPIQLTIADKLKDRKYRHEFFKRFSQRDIAVAIQAMREKRGMTQEQAAWACGMSQSAFSRIEQAEYGKWNFATLWRIAEGLDARWNIEMEPMEDATKKYDRLETL